jgi:biotin carboxylase
VCIVEGYSSGALIPAELAARGVDCIHVQLEDPINAYDLPTFEPAAYIDRLLFTGEFERLCADVKQHRPLAVLPGAETGVLMADRLSEALGLPTNGTALSAARRDKQAMQQRVADAGLRSIPSRATAEWSELEAWFDQLGDVPIVIKPPAAAGTDHVSICRDRARAREAFTAILGQINTLGLRNERVMAQPFVAGEEYAVDTASWGGNHQITSIWHQHKIIGDHPVYDFSELVDSRAPELQPVTAYVFAVLDALGIRFGAGHTEVIVDRDGPVLVETGARTAGGKVQAACKRAYGFSQTTITLDAYLDPMRFYERMRAPYRTPPHVRRVWLSSPKTGTLTGLPHVEDAKRLASAFWVKMSVAVGQRVERTINLDTLPGWIDLVHEDPGTIASDYEQIRRWERADFYQVG